MTGDPAGPQRPGRLIANLMAQYVFGLLAMTICVPSMQQWPVTFATSQAQVQLTLSGYVAAYGILQLVHGALSDRIGRKPVLLAGLGLAFVGSALAAAASDLWMLIAARVLQGAGSAAGVVVGRAMVQDLFAGPERTRVMAFIGMTIGLSPPLAMLLGGQVHSRLGWQANFVAMAVLAALLMVAAWWGLPTRKPQDAQPPGGWSDLFRGYAHLARQPGFLLHVLILAMTSASFYAFLGGAPIVLAGYGVKPEQIGWYIMSVPCAYVLGNLLCTRLVRWLPDSRIMLLGHLCTVTSVVLVLALGLAGLHTPLGLSLPLMLLGIGHGLLMPATLGGALGLVPALAGSAAAVGGLMQQLTGALGGFIVGLMPHVGPVNLGLQMLVSVVAGLLAQLALLRTLRSTKSH
ncbi:multidrug effflux MFS transporter [Aquincola sp. S2]|uniref:Bcr/CflA family efflux transporter n=1 Tax=Pseudaquabacterium terrae TaxID=2732868 RepID=A0ABX2EF19_9BURK|nr:multidrug effflux MFS transporter [Aquabacterium terrae]NRF67191.1 multidrug effflux MFS transporter [Aquabacterium terrae]